MMKQTIALVVSLAICFAAAGIRDEDVPQAVNPLFQHLITTYASETNKTVSMWRAVPDIFFGSERPGLALADVLLLRFAIVATTGVFWHRSMVAGILFVPYLGWVTFASVLNFVIWRLNM
jgi:tryptophan-rich sensory protein